MTMLLMKERYYCMEIIYTITTDRIARLVEEQSFINDFNRFSTLQAYCESLGVNCYIANGLRVNYRNEITKKTLAHMALSTYFPNKMDLDNIYFEEDKSFFFFELPKMGLEYKKKHAIEINAQYVKFCLNEGCLTSSIRIIRLMLKPEQEMMVRRMVDVLFFPENLPDLPKRK